ncbi:NACHT and WD repeat domain-containing protein [Streptomyces zaehneri]|uniref:NACHT and WD repeat domain-containing protein n=1 Tax=Streptomyces zaehneri TaxID=3051180 RepID=UPI0028D40FE8|nr:AAA family ATPase [Streptomyces sp. DSM 40713]
MNVDGGLPDDGEPVVSLSAWASGEARVNQAGGDLSVTEQGNVYIYYEDGSRRIRRTEADGLTDECPYPGLASFDLEHAGYFFGRDEAIAELARRVDDKLRTGGPLALVAPSGAGKSSLLKAGLLKRIAQNALPGSARWIRICLTPTATPVAALCSAVARHVPGLGADHLARALEHGPDRCVTLLAEALRSQADVRPGERPRLMVVVDQLEELFSMRAEHGSATAQEEERRRFLDLLVRLSRADPDEGPVGLVVLGLRSDFYTQCTQYPQLRTVLQHSQVLLGPLSKDGLRDAVLLPARAAGLEVEDGLLEVLLRDLGVSRYTGTDPVPDPAAAGAYEAGRLPLLAHALRATWLERCGNTLTVDGYAVTGGIHDAVAADAERLFGTLGDEEEPAAQAAFLRLTKIGDGGEHTRRRLPCAELLGQEGETSPTAQVIDAFTGGRLLTRQGDTVEITHEALLYAWPRLRRWIEDDRAGQLVRQDLEEAATVWQAAGRDRAMLHRGIRLESACAWVDAHGPGSVGVTASAFLKASTQQRKRAARVRRALTAALCSLALVASTAAVVAFHQRADAQEQRRIAVTRQLASQSALLAPGHPEASMLSAIAAHETSPESAEGRNALLSSQSQRFKARIAGHPGPLYAVAFSPDGRSVATAGTGDGIDMSDAHGPRGRSTVVASATGGIGSLAFAPDGRTLAVGCADGTVRLWKMPEQRWEILAAPGGGAVLDVAFSPDGHTVASAGENGTARLWDIGTRTVRVSLTGHSGTVHAVAFSPDGGTLATGGTDRTVRLWDAETGRSTTTLTSHGDTVTSVAFNPEGGTLATASGDGNVQVWDWKRRRMANVLEGHTSGLLDVAFSPDGRTLATGAGDRTARLWDPATGLNTVTLTGHTNIVGAVAFSPDGRTLATASDDRTAVLWALDGPALITYPATSVQMVAFSPDGRFLASTHTDGALRLWPARGRIHRPLRVLRSGTAGAHGVAFSPDGRLVAVSSVRSGDVLLWNVATGKTVATLHGGGTAMAAVAFSPDGRTLAGASPADGSVKLWDVKGGRLTAVIANRGATVWAVAFSPDGQTLASSGGDETARLWDVSSHRLLATFKGHTGVVWGVAFSPDGHTLATTGDDGAARLWDVPGRRLVATLKGHTGATWGVAFSPDGHTLATTGDDGTARLWDVARHSPSAVLQGHTDQTRGVAFSPDGHTLATAGNDATVRVWKTDPVQVTADLCARIGPVTPRRWRELLPDQPFSPVCRASASAD